jgi:hypothetical protein
MEKPYTISKNEADTIIRIAKIVAPNITKGGIDYDFNTNVFILSSKTVPVVEFILDFIVHKGAIFLSGKQFPIPLLQQNIITNDFIKEILANNVNNFQFLTFAIMYLNKKIPHAITK